MKDSAETAFWVLSIIIVGSWWWSQVDENDKHLEATARCADAAGEPGTVSWRKAWDVCFEVMK
jgi:hypothetical protein